MNGTHGFQEWLEGAIRDAGETHRGLARKIAAQHPEGASESTIESARTTLRRILGGKLNPTQPTRDAIQEALGRDDAPTVDEERASDDPTFQEMVLYAREGIRHLRKLERWASRQSGCVA